MGDIVIKKIKKSGGHGHHGGAWKVAYADFVTAMMAFFLLLWLLNATTEEQRMGLADFFSPVPGAMQSTTGGTGVTSGQSITTEGQMTQDRSAIGVTVMIPEETQEQVSESETPSEEEAEEVLDQRDEEQFDEAQDALEEAMENDAELEELGKSLIIDQTPEGLRIQIVDQEGVAMFQRGRTTMSDEARKLIDLVVKAVASLPNKITITGHTDATKYTRFGYDNWDLSTDRANSSRRALIKAGFEAKRIFRVTGRAAADPLDAEDPTAPINRRISMVLLRQSFVRKFEEQRKISDIEVLKEINEETIEGSSVTGNGVNENGGTVEMEDTSGGNIDTGESPDTGESIPLTP